jgi:hypothetical protein
MSLLGVAPSDEHKAVLRSLGNGECIFRDLDDRAGRIGIDLVSDELRDWIDTNPTRARQSRHSQADPATRRESSADEPAQPTGNGRPHGPPAASTRAAEASS